MKKAAFSLGLLMSAMLCLNVQAQTVTFSNPAPWLTEKSAELIIRAQFDTSRVFKKNVKFVLSKIENGQKKPVVTKQFVINDFSQEYNLGIPGPTMIGGRSFLKLEWSIPDTNEKGDIAPIGYVPSSQINMKDTIHVYNMGNASDAASLGNAVKGKPSVKIGSEEFVLGWTKSAFIVACKKSTAKEKVKFAFDGKNGKNAFVSYPDRFILVNASGDSLKPVYFTRTILNDTIKYEEKPWMSEIAKETDVNYIYIKIPWHDLAVIPFEGRMTGFAAWATDEKGSTDLAAVPNKATKWEMPGSWGNLVLDK